ncbi:hypothetical protein GGR50DRAFT_637118 [Xylaria sp. CBS 124048]|nr:hypothetical protein GGR50DRAFT_637118 [Xylaria sp. CBS 124048]
MEIPPGVDVWKVPAAKAPPGFTSDFNNTDSSAPLFIGVSSLFLTIAVICVSLKLYVRFFIHRKPGLDDLCTVFALILQVAYTALVDYMFIQGGARHQWNMPLGLFLWVHKVQTQLAIIQMPTYLFTKLSILFLYYRLFSPKPLFKWIIIAGCAVVTGSYISFLFVFIFGKTISVLVPASHGVACINLITDVFLFVLPMAAIGSLNLPKARKVGAAGIFAAGALACALSALALYYRFQILDGVAAIDMTYTFSSRTTVVVVEIYIGIIVGCLPLFPALLSKTIITKFFSNTFRSLRERLVPSTGASGSKASQAAYLDDHMPLSSYRKTKSSDSRDLESSP